LHLKFEKNKYYLFAKTNLFYYLISITTSVDIGASAKLELVDKFCYLGDMLSVDGDADAAVEARIRINNNNNNNNKTTTYIAP